LLFCFFCLTGGAKLRGLRREAEKSAHKPKMSAQEQDHVMHGTAVAQSAEAHYGINAALQWIKDLNTTARSVKTTPFLLPTSVTEDGVLQAQLRLDNQEQSCSKERQRVEASIRKLLKTLVKRDDLHYQHKRLLAYNKACSSSKTIAQMAAIKAKKALRQSRQNELTAQQDLQNESDDDDLLKDQDLR
jgi:hypothetical protein